MRNFSVSFALLLSVGLLLSEKKLQVKADQCSFNVDCGLNKYCCKQRYEYQTNVCRLSCVGQPCRRNSDCGGPNECCNSTKLCTKSGCDECSFNRDCGKDKYCCKQRYRGQQNICGYGGCVGQPCNSDSDCGGPGECCNSTNHCTNLGCNECSSNSDCGYNKYCCMQRYRGQQHICAHGGCVGQSCNSDSDCGGPGECCNSTSHCTNLGCNECSSNSDCGYNKYCCKQRYTYQHRVCGHGGCIHRPCNWDNDCGGPGECCNSTNHCTKYCNECSSNSDCGYKYCCKRKYTNQGYVCVNGGCVGRPCSSDSDCGGPGECCRNNSCTKSAWCDCSSNWDCGLNEYCCKQRYRYQTNVCRLSCFGQPCSSHSDCGRPGECCNWTNYQCTNSNCNECSFNSDCGKDKYCCKQRYYYQQHICGHGGCVGQPCKVDSDCGGPNECCNSTKYCTNSSCNECSSNRDCGSNRYCCKQRYIFYFQHPTCRLGGCIHWSCNRDSDCGGPGECCRYGYCTKSGCNECSSNWGCGYNKYCCKRRYSDQNNVCVYGGCVGRPCSSNSDCRGSGECCNSKKSCTTGNCDECSSNSNCSSNYYCCKQRYTSQNHICSYGSCVGKFCNWDRDCGGPGECCNLTNHCTNSSCDECSSNSDCGYNKYCCKQRLDYQHHVCVYGGCAYRSCHSDSDCGGPGECCSSSKYCKTDCNECSSNSDCYYNQYCCKQQDHRQRGVCSYDGCIGKLCSSDSDCGGPGECCNLTNHCTKSGCNECSSNSDCGYNKYCCKQKYTYQHRVCGHSGCIHRPCNWDSDCGGPGECCNSTNHCTKYCNECSSNSDCDNNYYCCKQRYANQVRVCGYYGCVGQSCNWDSDCGGPGECCRNNYCTKSDCFKNVAKGLASWIIAVIVVSVLVALVIPVAIVVCFCRGVLSVSRSQARPGEVLNQETGSTFIALRNTQAVQNNPVQFQIRPYPPPAYSEQEQDLLIEHAQVYFPPPDYTLHDTDGEWCDNTDAVTTV